MFVEKLCRRCVAADFHVSELRKLPAIEIGGSGDDKYAVRDGLLENYSPNEADVDTHVTVHTRAI